MNKVRNSHSLRTTTLILGFSFSLNHQLQVLCSKQVLPWSEHTLHYSLNVQSWGCHTPSGGCTYRGRLDNKFSYDWNKNFDLRNCVIWSFLGSIILREKRIVSNELIMAWDSTGCSNFHCSSCFFCSHAWLVFEIWRNCNMHGFQSPSQNFIFIPWRESVKR